MIRRPLSTALVLLTVGALALTSACSDDANVSGTLITDSSAPTESGAPPVLENPSATGRELATEFLTILQKGDLAALDAFLDDSFQLQRADGSGQDKAAYLRAPARITAFELGQDVVASQQGGVLSVRWRLVVDGIINGTEVERGEAPRLSTFVWRGDRWRMSSHANFLLPTKTAPVLSDPSATGRELVTRFIEILKNKDRTALEGFLAEAFQIQRADGSAANRDEYLNAEISISSFELGPNVVAVQSGGTLTVRWSIKLVETIDGQPTGTGEAPRLSAFIWADGTWKLLSHANFNRIEG